MPNRLFLSVAGNSQNKVLHPVLQYFQSGIRVCVNMDLSQKSIHWTTFELKFGDDSSKKEIINFLSAADLSVQEIELFEDRRFADNVRFSEKIPNEIRERFIEGSSHRPRIGHKVYDGSKALDEVKYFDLYNEESTGTIAMYEFASEVLNSLKNGTVFIIDEFNSGLHPLLNKFIIDLYNDPEINKNNAQLFVSTHDVCVLDFKNLKREQVWFCDKLDTGAAEIVVSRILRTFISEPLLEPSTNA